jgi:hypothetical protein
MSDLYLMLIKVAPTLARNATLADWIDDIDSDYMTHFPELVSLAHVKLDGAWDFGLLFHGTAESVQYLDSAIRSKGPSGSIVEILTMPAVDLDDYTDSLR